VRSTGDILRAASIDRSATTLTVVAAIVALADLLTKQVAVTQLGSGADFALGDAIRLALFHNHGLAWGLSGGGQALAITLAGTALLLVAVAAVRRPLAVVDRSSPRMLGLIIGAAVGNAASLFLWPAGAPDFIALDTGGGSEAVINVADVALFLGLALCCRTTWRIAVALHAERERRPSLARSARLGDRIATRADATRADATRADVPRAPRRPLEREVPLIVARDDGRRPARDRGSRRSRRRRRR
jgi:lipoprotein signal peptidase